jgi:hypothetical protein
MSPPFPVISAPPDKKEGFHIVATAKIPKALLESRRFFFYSFALYYT